MQCYHCYFLYLFGFCTIVLLDSAILTIRVHVSRNNINLLSVLFELLNVFHTCIV